MFNFSFVSEAKILQRLIRFKRSTSLYNTLKVPDEYFVFIVSLSSPEETVFNKLIIPLLRSDLIIASGNLRIANFGISSICCGSSEYLVFQFILSTLQQPCQRKTTFSS